MLSLLCMLKVLDSLLRALYNCWRNLLWLCQYSSASAEGWSSPSACSGAPALAWEAEMGGGVWLLGEKPRRKSTMVSWCLKGSNLQHQYLVILALLWVLKDPRGLWNLAPTDTWPMSFFDLLWKSNLHDSKTSSGKRFMRLLNSEQRSFPTSYRIERRRKSTWKWPLSSGRGWNPHSRTQPTLTLHTRPQKHGRECAVLWPPWNQPHRLEHLAPSAQHHAVEVELCSYMKWEKHVRKLWNQGMLLSRREDLSSIFAGSLLGL